jgi:hypothetical protein
VQAVPFSENEVGEASLADQVPWNPNEVLPPAGMVAL